MSEKLTPQELEELERLRSKLHKEELLSFILLLFAGIDGAGPILVFGLDSESVNYSCACIAAMLFFAVLSTRYQGLAQDTRHRLEQLEAKEMSPASSEESSLANETAREPSSAEAE